MIIKYAVSLSITIVIISVYLCLTWWPSCPLPLLLLPSIPIALSGGWWVSFKFPHSNHHHQQQTTGFGRVTIFFMAEIVRPKFLTPGTQSTCSPRPWCPTALPQGAGPPGCRLCRLVCLCLYPFFTRSILPDECMCVCASSLQK